MRQSVGRTVGLVVLGLLIIVLVMTFANREREPVAVQVEATQTPTEPVDAYPPPPTAPPPQPPEAYPPPPTEPPSPTPFPTPTTAPVPTPPPTPVVTPIPTAEPPIIPVPPEQAEPYTLVFPEDHVLRAINSDGTNQRTLVDVHAQLSLYLAGKRVASAPFAWGKPAPDGRQVALVLSNTEGEFPSKGESPEYNIYVLDVETKRLQLLVRDGAAPAWSPDGTRIAYRHTKTHGLWVVDVATGETSELYGTDRTVNFLTWSPDGRKIAFVDGNVGAIWVIDATGQGEAVQLVPREMYAGYLNWSPDGDQILFTSRAGTHRTPSEPFNLWAVNVETSQERQLTQDIFVAGVTAWSSSGNWFVFAGNNLLDGDTPPPDLWLMAKDGGNLKRLTSDPASDLYPFWVSSGKVVFLKEDAGILEMDLSDGTLRQILPKDTEYIVLK